MSKNKNVNVWHNYDINIPKNDATESKNLDLQTFESVQVQNSTLADLQTFASPQVQTFESTNLPNYTSLDLQTFESLKDTEYRSIDKENSKQEKQKKNKKLSYKDRGWFQMTAYVSQKSKKKLYDKAHKEEKDISFIIDELIINKLEY